MRVNASRVCTRGSRCAIATAEAWPFPLAEIAVVDPIPAKNAYEPGMGAGVVNPTDLVHGPLAYSAVEKILNCPIQKISREKLWEMRPLVKGHAALLRQAIHHQTIT